MADVGGQTVGDCHLDVALLLDAQDFDDSTKRVDLVLALFEVVVLVVDCLVTFENSIRFRSYFLYGCCVQLVLFY